MKRTIIALAALVALSATPAFAGLIHEAADEKAAPVQLVASPQEVKGFGRLVTSETDGIAAPARIDAVRQAAYPQAERPVNRGR